MKVALLSDCYLPRLGGIEVQTHDLAGHLVTLGHHVEVFTATPGPRGEVHGQVTVVDGIPVHRLAIRLPWELPVNPAAPRELRRRLVAGGFDVAHVQTGVVSPFAWDCTRMTVALGLPTALTWHCMLGPAAGLFRAARFVRGWAGRGVAMSAVSGAAAEPLRRIVGEAGEVSVLPNGIDVARWRPPQATTGRGGSSGPLRLVTAMRLAPRKRPVALLDLVRRAADLAGPGSLDLTILGEGPERRRVEARLHGHDLDWVHLPGRVPRDELPGRYAAADLYLSPSRLESFGIAALEARTAGLPVIGRRGSGVGEFVTDGIGGRIVDGDIEMAEVIAALAGDRSAVERMRARNIARPPSQDWPNVAALAVAEYERAQALARLVKARR
ncbi:MAG: glycosyltransferase family 4 protein [Intrasporangium sp.]|uniref:glycosyltransferase family 4 protein n=1 Tax=Intrasporangium sp. TaxID=1925024 RepID=UPI002648D17B|nr:glycosyltransferase family 4 protein [Intrasporangium sp.]MDN5795539.1 glycosyltransferase family 4 protein [Intrasporangium sp.]